MFSGLPFFGNLHHHGADESQGLCCLNRAERPRDLDASRRSANRGQPYGSEEWIERVTKRYGLESAFRARGRPCRNPKHGS